MKRLLALLLLTTSLTLAHPKEARAGDVIYVNGCGSTTVNHQDPTNGNTFVDWNTGNLCTNASFSGPITVAATAPYVFTSKGFQQISVTTAVGFTPPAGSTVCFIQTETEPVRYRTDGTNPTTSVGMLLAIGQQLQLTASLATVTFIATTGTATLDVDCYQ